MTSIPVILRRRRRISVGPTGPTNTVAPVVSGTATVGQTLSTTNGTWSGVGTITYAYQWLDDGVAISGATSSTYTLTAGEEGGFISCRVTATDDNGSTAATSNSLGPVAAATGAPLDLDFATGTYVDNASNTTLATIATFARSSSATYVDSSGVVQTASSGTIRDAHHEWNGSSWVRKGLLLETDAATNLNPNSVDSTTFLKTSGSFAGTTSGPDNVAGSADRYIPSSNGYIYKVLGGTSGRCASFYIKPDATNLWAWVGVYNGSSAYAAYGVFNLSTGAVVSTGGASFVAASIEPAANGFFRCAVSISSTTNAAFACTGLPTSTPTFNGAGQPLYTADGGGCYIFGGQLEAGDYPSSYIPTSGATATRAGETLSVNAAGVPWSTTAMSWVFEGEASWVDNGSVSEVLLYGKYADANNNITNAVSTAGGNTGRIFPVVETGGVTETANGPTNTPTGYRNTIKAGMRYTTTDLQAVDTGTSGVNETAVGGSIYDYATNTQDLAIGGRGLTYAYNGTIQRLRMWDSDIGASELETETA